MDDPPSPDAPSWQLRILSGPLRGTMHPLVDRFGMYEAPTLYMENVKIDGHWVKGPVISNHYGHWDTECLVFGMNQTDNGDYLIVSVSAFTNEPAS